MIRRTFLASLPLAAVMPVLPNKTSTDARATPPLVRFTANIADVSAETDWIVPADARQFISDAIRDMSTVMAQGKKYPERPEPAYLTAMVDSTISAAVERRKQKEIAYLKARIMRLEK